MSTRRRICTNAPFQNGTSRPRLHAVLKTGVIRCREDPLWIKISNYGFIERVSGALSITNVTCSSSTKVSEMLASHPEGHEKLTSDVNHSAFILSLGQNEYVGNRTAKQIFASNVLQELIVFDVIKRIGNERVKGELLIETIGDKGDCSYFTIFTEGPLKDVNWKECHI